VLAQFSHAVIEICHGFSPEPVIGRRSADPLGLPRNDEVTGVNPAFPAQWFHGLFRALHGERILVVTLTSGLRLVKPGRA
jgi:hypothetical protein